MYILMIMKTEETHRRSVAEARRNLPRLIRAAEDGRTVEITRRGEPVAVLVSSRRFAQLGPKRPGFMEACRAFVRKTDIAELDLDPDKIFAGARDRSPGRDFQW